MARHPMSACRMRPSWPGSCGRSAIVGRHPFAVLSSVVLAMACIPVHAQSVVDRAEQLAAKTGRALVVLLTDDT